MDETIWSAIQVFLSIEIAFALWWLRDVDKDLRAIRARLDALESDEEEPKC